MSYNLRFASREESDVSIGGYVNEYERKLTVDTCASHYIIGSDYTNKEVRTLPGARLKTANRERTQVVGEEHNEVNRGICRCYTSL